MTTIPVTSAEISTDWLNAVLDDDVRGGACVTAVDVTVIGFLGEVARLTLTYDTPTAEPTMSMISKLSTANEGFKHVGLLLGPYEKEAGFYREVAPEMEVDLGSAEFLS